MGLQELNNGHQKKDQLTFDDVMVLFMLKAPDQGKAMAALGDLFGTCALKRIIDYKHNFKSYQDWRQHLIAALDNAQANLDATKQSIVKQSIVNHSKAKQSHE